MLDPHFRARARYAFMLGLPDTFSRNELDDEAEKYEQCRFGSEHEAWRYGYFGERYFYGYGFQYGCGIVAARCDLCPRLPPGLEVEDAQTDWTKFEAYFRTIVEREQRMGPQGHPGERLPRWLREKNE